MLSNIFRDNENETGSKGSHNEGCRYDLFCNALGIASFILYFLIEDEQSEGICSIERYLLWS